MSDDVFDFTSCDDDPIDLLKDALLNGAKDDDIASSLKDCVRRNDWDACAWLALCYKIGYGVPVDDFVCDVLLSVSKSNGSSADKDVFQFLKELEQSPKTDESEGGNDEYTVVDIETTGLNPFEDDITELAALKIRGGVVVDKFQELVRTEKTIPDVVVRKTHITNEMVANARSVRDVLSAFLDFIGNDTLVGYNIDRFDLAFIAAKVRSEINVEFQPKTIDVWRFAKQRLKGVCSYSLDNLRRIFAIETRGAHRALKDCHDTNNIYRRLLAMPGCSCSEAVGDASGDREMRTEEMMRQDIATLKRAAELLAMIPDGFEPLMKPDVPVCYKDRWAYVTAHPFETFASSTLSITGDSPLVPRCAAEEIVTRLGARLRPSTTRDCDFCVVLCDQGTCKKASAEKWIAKGSPLRIIGPDEFLDIMKSSIAERQVGC